MQHFQPYNFPTTAATTATQWLTASTAASNIWSPVSRGGYYPPKLARKPKPPTPLEWLESEIDRTRRSAFGRGGR